ncbi:hypothetical protein PIB30_011416 [Stylosanthes scabra]|uniref:Uncharacterized protein n=1 Tax=Stylosanthes scabra TaxID=79078 RepID=A0ABU6Z3F7_9FABA|nr:hypothetical protein [Stylosanthes scabra]
MEIDEIPPVGRKYTWRSASDGRSGEPWMETLCVPMTTTDPRLDGLSPKGNKPPKGGGVNPYPKIRGIHNNGGPKSYNRTRVNPASPGRTHQRCIAHQIESVSLRSPYCWQGRSVNGIEINSVPPICCP